jgi:hypothetical protein
MISNEASMKFLEDHIPDLADAAFTQAYWQTLANGKSVLKVEQGEIIEIFPDGSRKVIKQIAPLIPVPIRTKRRTRNDLV